MSRLRSSSPAVSFVALVLSLVSALAAQSPNLVVSATARPKPASLGELMTFSVTVTNRGTATATQVVLSNSFSATATFFGATVSQGTYFTGAGFVNCPIGALAPGAGATVTIVLTPTQSGTVTNVALAKELETDASPADNIATQTVLCVPHTFYTGPDLIVPRAYHTATRLPNGKVLITGGNTETNWTASCELYDPATKTFTLTGSMQRRRALHAATLLNDGTVLVTGIAYDNMYAAEVYDPASGTFTAVSNTLYAHQEHTSTLLGDGRVLIVADSYTYPLNAAEIYVPALRAFTNITGSIYGSAKNRGILLDDGRVLLAGGVAGGGWSGGVGSEIFNPSTSTFTALPPLNAGRAYYGAAKLADGRVLIAGGIGGGQQNAELFYTNTQTFVSVTNRLRGLHYTANANRLPDGKVLVTGYSRETDLFDPATDSILRAVEMQTGRNYATATSLADGTVLIAGGLRAGDFAMLGSSEIYDPARTKAPPAISIGNPSIIEGNGISSNLVFTVSLSAPMGVPVSVAYATASWSAAEGEDFAATNGVVVFEPGATNLSIYVTTFGDLNFESDELLNVSLSNPTNAAIDVATGTGTIVNDDPLPTLTASSAARYEGNRFSTNLIFDVSLSAMSYQDVTADYATVDNVAEAGTDYVATNGTVHFSPGTTNQTISVLINGDLEVEPHETFSLQFSNVVNAANGIGPVVGTILDDDGSPGWLHHFDIALPAGPRFGQAPLPLTITAKDVSGNLATNFNGRVLLSVGWNDEPPQHYGFEDGVLGTWTPSNGGQQPGPYEVKVFDVNGDGEFSFGFRTVAGIGVDGITRPVTLTGGRKYFFSGDFAQSNEGSGPNGGDTTAHFSLGGAGTSCHFGGVNNGDVLRSNLVASYTAPYSGEYTLSAQFQRDPWFQLYAIGAWADDVTIGAAPVTPRITASFTNGVWTGAPTVGVLGDNFVLHARDVEGHPGISAPFNLEQPADVALVTKVTPSPPRVGQNLVITVTATNIGPGTAPAVVLTNLLPTGPAVVSVSSSSGSHVIAGGVVTANLGPLPSGEAASLTVTLRPSSFVTVTNLAWLAASAYDLVSSNNSSVAAIPISPALVSVAGASVVEPTSATTNLNFTVTVGEPHDDTIVVDYATADATATATGLDYVAKSGQLTFPPGVNTQIVNVIVLDDDLAELTESFRLQLSNPVNAALAGVGYGTGNILRDTDPVPELTINDVALLEGDAGTTNAVFTVTLSRPAGYSLSVLFGTTNGTATNTSDYVATSGPLTFAVGQTSHTITVPVRGNTVNEPAEVFYVNITTNRQEGGYVILLDPQGVCTILNDDEVPGRLDHFEWTVSTPRIMTLPFAVTLRALDAFNNAATNALTSIPISATAGVKNTAIAILPTSAGPFTNSVWNGYVTINTTNSNVILRANDGQEHVGESIPLEVWPRIVTELVLPAGANENAGLLAAQATLRVGLARGEDTVFNLTSSDASELSVPATVVLPANTTNVAFDLTVVDDAILDGTRTSLVSLSATGYLATNAPFSIHDNETASLSLSAPPNTTEDLSVGGTVNASSPVGEDVIVYLTSSDPSQLQVPATTTIPQGQTSAGFVATPVDDQQLDGPRTVQILANVVNWTGGSAGIAVQDNETNTITITFAPPGPDYYEGSGAVSNAAILLGGSVTTNLTVSLASTDPTEAALPGSAIIPAGTVSVVLPLTIPDDADYDGTQTALLTPAAPGFTSITVAVTVGDNEMHHFSLGEIPANVEAAAAIPFSISLRDINDAVMTGYEGAVTIAANNAAGPVPVYPGNVALVAGTWSGTLVFPNWEYAGVRLSVSAGNVTNLSSVFNVVAPALSIVNAPGTDLAYSALSGYLYANAGSGYLTAVNAFQALPDSSVYIGSLGAKMVASGDGQFLYIERNGGNLCRFNVAQNTTDLFWSSGTPQIEDMAAVPGWANAVAVARMDTSTSPRSRGTIIYRDGVALPNTGAGNVIDFASPSQRLYAYNNETTGFGTAIYDIDANGLVPVKTVAMMSGFGVNFVCAGGLLFSSAGQVFNPDRAIVIGSNPAGMLVAGAPSEGRVYSWQNLGSGQSAIVARDLHTLVAVGSTTLPNVTSATGRLLRWGTNGLAFRLNDTSIAIVRSTLVPLGQPTDLVLTRTEAGVPAVVDDLYTCTYAISNAGPTTATNVVLSATVPPTANFVSATSPQGTCNGNSAGVLCNIPSIAPGAVASVTISLSPTKPGPLAFKVSALSETTDSNLANNRLQLDVPALFVSGYDTVVELSLPASDLVYDAANARICASVPNANELLGNSIVTFDPLSASYPSLIPTAVEPGKLAVADNGQYVYAALGSEASIQRVNLATRTADLKFPTGYNGVYDMEVMPGHPGVVAATVHTTVALYENGVKRPNVVAPTEYNFGYNLEFGASSNRLYASFPRGFRRINVDPNGATLIEDVRDSLISSYSYDMDYGWGAMYSIDGRVFDPETKATIMTLPYSGLVVAGPLSAYSYYLTTSGSTATLRIIDMPMRSEIRSLTIPGIGGSVASMIRWGDDGIAFRTTGGQVFLVRITLIDDYDGDGLADSWEKSYFGSSNGAGGGVNDDPDGDTLTNLDEFRAGTSPLDNQSFLQIQNIQATGTSQRISFLTAAGRRYRLERTTALTGNWVPVADNISGTGTKLEVTDNSSAITAFYRLVLLP